MKKLCAIGFLFLIVFVPPSLRAADEKVVQRLLDASVTINAPDGTGSGAVIVRGEDCYVLTAAHVVSACKPPSNVSPHGSIRLVPSVRFLFPLGIEIIELPPAPACGGGEWKDVKVYQHLYKNGEQVGKQEFVAEVVRYSEATDLAVLLIKHPKAIKGTTTFYLGKKVPALGLDLIHVGSPMGNYLSNSVMVGVYSGYDRRGEGRGSYDNITLLGAYPGCSGGLVTTPRGDYVGMVQRGAIGGAILIRPIRTIKKWSTKVGVEFLLDPSITTVAPEKVKAGAVEDLGEGQ